jgi:aminopeptidase N
MKNIYFFILWFALTAYSCGSPEKKTTNNIDMESSTLTYVQDHHSYAQPNEAVIKNMDLDIRLDFEEKKIIGKVSYDIVAKKDAKQIVLDSKYLEIEKVEANDKATNFTLGNFDKELGQSLTVDIPARTNKITIHYNTTDKTEALQWLSPQQTADKKHPFLFTQGQAILTRTWIPIQDSPQIRITYRASVKAPSDLLALMSAENPQQKNESGIYEFKMRQAIPPYLIALAVGDIAYKPVSSRTGVYAEPSMLDKAQDEFSDMEKMVQAAEGLYGDYDWDQFDVIVLPPSFPFGGMENPRLTFATPTVIAGDKSLTSLIAHELAHSWSGNLVTNASWDDFWLNEGFTVYFEMRIMEAVYGKERADMLAMISRQDLEEEIEGMHDHPEDTHLKLNLKGRNPDDGMNSIAYDKGYLFLRTLEEKVGREKFDAFLKQYFSNHAFSTIYTEKFLNYLNKNLLEKENITFNTDEWIYKAGIPDNQSIISSDKFKKVEKVLSDFVENQQINKKQTEEWTTQEWVHFVRNFPKDMPVEHFAVLDKEFDLSHSGNSYIAMVWYEQSILNNYDGNGVNQAIDSFLTTVGRRWYVSTLFRAFAKSNRLEEAKNIYKKSRDNYHSVTANTIDDILGV